MTDAPTRLCWFSTLVPEVQGGRVLEIGCGGGHLLELLARRGKRATMIGIDRSPLQVKHAMTRMTRLPEASRPVIHELALEEAASTLGKNTFTLILAMNVNLFWTDPARAAVAVRTLLTSRGQLLVGFEPPTASERVKRQARIREALSESFEIVSEHFASDGSTEAFAFSLVLGSG